MDRPPHVAATPRAPTPPAAAAVPHPSEPPSPFVADGDHTLLPANMANEPRAEGAALVPAAPKNVPEPCEPPMLLKPSDPKLRWARLGMSCTPAAAGFTSASGATRLLRRGVPEPEPLLPAAVAAWLPAAMTGAARDARAAPRCEARSPVRGAEEREAVARNGLPSMPAAAPKLRPLRDPAAVPVPPLL